MTNDLFMHCQGVDLISQLMEPVPFNAFFFYKKGLHCEEIPIGFLALLTRQVFCLLLMRERSLLIILQPAQFIYWPGYCDGNSIVPILPPE